MAKKEKEGTPGELLKLIVPDKPPLEDPPKFAAIAEAPAYHEVRNGTPLHPAGPSGSMWNRLLYIISVKRRHTYTGNFLHTELPGNDTEYLWKVTPKGRFKTHPDWPTLVERFYETLENIPTDLVFLLGETPLVGLFGPEYAHLSTLRGYPLYWRDKLIIPTHHPGSALPGRTPANFWLIYYDLLKGLQLQKHGRGDLPSFNIFIPGKKEIIQERL